MASFVPSKLGYLCVSNIISLLDYVVSSFVEILQNGGIVEIRILRYRLVQMEENYSAPGYRPVLGFMFTVLVLD